MPDEVGKRHADQSGDATQRQGIVLEKRHREHCLHAGLGEERFLVQVHEHLAARTLPSQIDRGPPVMYYCALNL